MHLTTKKVLGLTLMAAGFGILVVGSGLKLLSLLVQ